MIKNKFSKIALAAMATFMVISPTAMAAGTTADTQVNVPVIAGTLDLTADTTAVTFDGIALSDLLVTDQVRESSIPSFNIKDARGADTAWDLQISAAQFTDAVSSEVLPADILSIDNTGLASSESVLTLANTKSVLTGTGQSVVQALGGDGSGMGSFDFTGSSLVIDADSVDFPQYKAGNYTSTVNLTLVAGPAV